MTTNQCHVGMNRRGAAASTTDRSGRRGPAVRVSDAMGITIAEFVDAGFLFAYEDIDEVAGSLRDLIASGRTRLVLDVSGVRMMSSDVLAMLLDLRRRVDRVGGWLRLVGANANLRQMLRTCRVERYLPVVTDDAG